MAAKSSEEIVYQAVTAGELTIDSQGRVWRVKSRTGAKEGGTRTRVVTKRRAEHKVPLGYMQVRVMVNWVRTNASAHRLVWRHFHGSIPKNMTINHKNGVKYDNRPENLELATYSEQIKHSIRTLHQHQWILRQQGERNHHSKLTVEAVMEIRSLKSEIEKEIKTRHGHLMLDLAKKYGVKYQTIWDIVRGKRWVSIL